MTWRPGILQEHPGTDGPGVDHAADARPTPAGGGDGRGGISVLGIEPGARTEDAELAADRILEFLATAPPDIDRWAARQRAAVEEVAGQHAVETALGPAVDRAAQVPPAQPAPSGRPSRRRIPRALIVALLIPLVIWGVYRMGEQPGTSGAPAGPTAPVAAASTAQPLDAEQVAELEAKVMADPSDVEAMRELARLHLFAGDLEMAALWQQRILADHPEDIDARLALGVALFNQGELDAAEEQWLRAVELDPDAPEPHYNLGFLYVASDPPRMEDARAHWDTVVDLAPDSDMAKNIATHMGAVVDGSAPSDTPTGEP